jgi:hypothetical protein
MTGKLGEKCCGVFKQTSYSIKLERLSEAKATGQPSLGLGATVDRAALGLSARERHGR